MRGVISNETSNIEPMKFGVFALFLVIVISGCSDDQSQTLSVENLQGKWVDVKRTTDTLHFTPFLEGKDYVFLRRKELYRSGPYEYQLLPGGRISIHWLLAATISFEEYPIMVSGPTMTVGNFYDSPSGEMLTFIKVE